MKPVKIAAVLRVLVALLLAAGALSGCGDDDKETDKEDKNVTIGVVNLASSVDDLIEGYKTAMGELGYVEGQNITYIYGGAVGTIDLLDAEVQKMVDAKVDMVLSLTTPAALAAKRVTEGTDMPVLFFPSNDPVGSGVVDNMQNPGGNLTGIMTGQSGSKQLEWLQTIVPDIKRVYAPYNPDDSGSSSIIAAVRVDAERLGLDLVTVETPSKEAVLASLESMPEDIDAILVVADSLVGAQMADFIAFSLEHKLPLASTNRTFAEMGALMGFGGDQLELSRQAARLSQKILQGTPAGSLPVELAEFYLTVNLVTASAIGVTIPDNVLSAAKDIIRE